MPTYDQLRTEEEWRDQYVPANLTVFVQRLEVYYDPGVINIGAYGDNRHLKGYHRSRRWILGSRFATSRSYSVTETVGNRTGGDPNWISGVDIVVGYDRSRQAWDRVNLAKQQGRLPYIREILLERDPWHLHLGIDRASANRDFTELFQIITGQPSEGSGRVSFPVDMPVLRRGMEGQDVVTAQALLTARGFATELDGDFGPHTEEQTKSMQARYGAESVDGIWGQETWTIGITGEDRL